MKKRFTWVDVLVPAVIVLLVIGTFVKFTTLKHNNAEAIDFSYTMKIDGATDALADSLQAGDTVYDNSGKAAIGVISAVEGGTDGVILTIAAQGTPIDGGFRVGVYNIRPDYASTFFTKYSIWDGVVTTVQ